MTHRNNWTFHQKISAQKSKIEFPVKFFWGSEINLIHPLSIFRRKWPIGRIELFIRKFLPKNQNRFSGQNFLIKSSFFQTPPTTSRTLSLRREMQFSTASPSSLFLRKFLPTFPKLHFPVKSLYQLVDRSSENFDRKIEVLQNLKIILQLVQIDELRVHLCISRLETLFPWVWILTVKSKEGEGIFELLIRKFWP